MIDMGMILCASAFRTQRLAQSPPLVLYKSSSRTGGATQKRTGKRTREPHQFKREDRVAAGGVTFRPRGVQRL